VLSEWLLYRLSEASWDRKGGRMGRGRRRSWLLRAPALALALILASCATTPFGKAYQSAGVLIVANEQVQDECNRSKLQGRILAATEPDPVKAKEIRLKGLPPFTKSTCKTLAISYKLAAAAAKQALTLTGPGGTSTAVLTASGVQFVYTVSATLAQAGVKPAVQIQEFIEIVNGELLKATEVK